MPRKKGTTKNEVDACDAKHPPSTVLAALRDSRTLTNVDVCEKYGIGKSTLSRWQRAEKKYASPLMQRLELEPTTEEQFRFVLTRFMALTIQAEPTAPDAAKALVTVADFMDRAGMLRREKAAGDAGLNFANLKPESREQLARILLEMNGARIIDERPDEPKSE